MSSSAAKAVPNEQWHHLPASDVAERLATEVGTGLSEEEVLRRRERYGQNELKGKPGKSALTRFLMEFNQPLMYILLVAAVVTLLLQKWVDAGVIFAVTLINATIGWIQESKAENAIAALARSIATEATVIRDGEKLRVDARELVPGDVVVLAAGDKVPADLRLATMRDLQVSEAALTGESVPVEKAIEPLDAETPVADRLNMAYAGSLVTVGQARGIVVGTGEHTETGRISQLMEQSVGLETPLTRRIQEFSKTLLFIILGFAAFAFVVVLVQGGNWADGFAAAVALAVSAIPEGLPAVVTVTLAIGVGRMARQHAIIRKLPAVETLGSTTVICSDKTGTLTENQMTVQRLYAGGALFTVSGVGYEATGEIARDGQPVDLDAAPAVRECLVCGLLCNDAGLQEQDARLTVVGNPTEGALIVSAGKAGLTAQSLSENYARLDTIPFESQFQYMATLYENAGVGANIVYVKGSAEAVLTRCRDELGADGQPTPLNREAVDKATRDMASQGLRVLAFARIEAPADLRDITHKHVEDNLVFLGLQGMIDPPRPEAIEAVRACRSAGIQVKMITGDHALTARAIARQMKLGEDDAPVLTGQDLSNMDDDQLAESVEASIVFARVAPEQKLRLVEALQFKKHVVAMTGDGVNDAPALKQADIGVAMGITGTEVAKEAADMVLTDDNFASIEAAVGEGRTVYRNLLKTIGFILPVNGGEGMTIMMGILLAASLPILPVQILWVNMVSSVALSATLAFEPRSKDIMRRPPRPPNEPLLSGRLLLRVLAISAFNLIAVFGMFEWVWQSIGNIDLARTMAVHTLVAAETFYLLSISAFIPSLFGHLKDKTREIAYVPAIGVASVLLLQFLFSQLPISNPLFHTQALNSSQALMCIGAGFPVVVPALLLKRFAPLA